MQLIAYSQFTDARQIVSVDGLSEALIGRDDDNTLALPSPFVSRHHAKVIFDNGNFYVENLGLNGTIVRGENVPVGTRVELRPGEEFKVGEFSVYQIGRASCRERV